MTGSPGLVAAYAVQAVRDAENVVLAQVPEGALMQRAAAALAAVCARRLRQQRGRLRGRQRGKVTGARVVVLAGAGNNGGDALWAGARLARRGARVDAVLLAPSAHGPGLAALRAAGGRAVTVAAGEPAELGPVSGLLAAADVVLDGIVGLGGSPGLREPATSVNVLLDGLRPRPLVVAVDLPSGVHPDTGTTPGAHVHADVTVTFGAAKPCLLVPPACHAAGEIEIVDLGLRPYLPPAPAVARLMAAGAAARWPVPGPADDKYSRGVLGLVAGSDAYPGAAVLAAGGALRAGAGMVRYVGPERAAAQVLARWPEVVAGSGRVQAWALGSGIDPGPGNTTGTGTGPDDDGQVAAVLAALEQCHAEGLPAVVDAGALTLLARPDARRLAGPHLLLTPHAGELARLLGAWQGTDVTRQDVEHRPLESVRTAAALTGAAVLLKGAVTLVAAPGRPVLAPATGPAWLATAGAGDVLAGIAGTLLAAGLAPSDAGAVAAHVHGQAAALAARGGPIVAGDVSHAVPDAVRALLAAVRH